MTSKNGVDKPEDVNATLIRGVRVRFIPETRYRGAGKGRVSTRGLSDVDIEWESGKEKRKTTSLPTPLQKARGVKIALDQW